MLKPDWNQAPPDSAAIRILWQNPVFSFISRAAPSIDDLLKELRGTHVNGGACFACFRFPSEPVIDWFISRNRFEAIEFFEHLLTSDALATALPSLQAPLQLDALKWEWWSPYLLAGDWARTLMNGGAYKKYEKGGKSAKELAERACADAFQERFEDVEVFRCATAWSDWFFDVAWDMTWIGVDKRKLELFLLCLTDTD